MNLYESIILSFIDVILYVVISQKLIKRPFKIKFVLVITVIFSIAIGIESHYITEWTSIIYSNVLLLLLCFFLYKQKIVDMIYLHLISTILILAIQFIALLPLYILFGSIIYNFSYGLIAQIINVVFIVLFVRFVPIEYIYTYVLNKNKVFNYLLANSFTLMLFMQFYWNINVQDVLGNLMSIIFLSLIIMSINFIILKNGLRNDYINNNLQIYKQYFPIIDELITDIKTRQHDFRNHIQALDMIIYTSQDKSEIIERFKKYSHEIAFKEDLNELLKLGNKIILGFLYSKKIYAEQLGIKVSIIIKEFAYESQLYEFQWIEILGILMDNAMETKGKDNHIITIIDKEEDMNSIIVKNKHPYIEKEIISKFFEKGFSNKSNSNWGYGLYNLKKIVNQNKGYIEVYNEQDVHNYVVFKVIIP